MTEPGIYYPDHISALQLDAFLARGWYRMGQGIFTTNYIVQADVFYRVYWLRYDLKKLTESRTTRCIKHINRGFTVKILPLKVTAEMEVLFNLYKSGIDFEPAHSVKSWLYDAQQHNVYNSYMIEVRDGKKLVASGVYDLGNMSMAGIINFYDPAYKKCSPGKFLMLLKIQEAKALGLSWYYPGYIVYQYPKFDYKLFAGKSAAELYSPEANEWLAYREGLADEMAMADPFKK